MQEKQCKREQEQEQEQEQEKEQENNQDQHQHCTRNQIRIKSKILSMRRELTHAGTSMPWYFRLMEDSRQLVPILPGEQLN